MLGSSRKPRLVAALLTQRTSRRGSVVAIARAALTVVLTEDLDSLLAVRAVRVQTSMTNTEAPKSPGGTERRAGHLTEVSVISGTLSTVSSMPAAPKVLKTAEKAGKHIRAAGSQSHIQRFDLGYSSELQGLASKPKLYDTPCCWSLQG